MQPQSMFAQHYILSFTCAFAYISPPIPSKHCTSHQNFDIMVEKSRPEFGPLSPPECTPPLQAGFDANRPMALIQGQTHPNGCILPPMTSSRHSHSPFTQPPHATPPLSAQPEIAHPLWLPPECTPPLQAGFDANRPMALIQGQTHPNGCILPPMTSSRHSHSPFTQPPHATLPLSAQPETTTMGDFHGFLKVRFRPLPFLESFNGPQIWIPR